MSGVGPIGPLSICYGTRITPLPDAVWVVNQIKALGATRIMLCVTDPNAIGFLQATMNDPLAKSTFKVVLGVANSELGKLEDPKNAEKWAGEYVFNYRDIISHVCVGYLSQLSPGHFRSFTHAIQNVAYNLPKPIKVSTMVDVTMLVHSESCDVPYNSWIPPSRCLFSDTYKDLLNHVVIPILKASSSPLFAAIMPYFEIDKQEKRSLSNFLINPDASDYLDDCGCKYKYVYDAMLDAVYRAYAANLRPNERMVEIYVLTGWPTAPPTPHANRENQEKYVNNLRVHGATPKISTIAANYIYCLLDEKNNPRSLEELKHFGITTFP